MSKKIRIINCGKNWIKFSINIIEEDFPNIIKNSFVVLTGGRYTQKIYSKKNFKRLININKIILSDERITRIFKLTNMNVIKRYFKKNKIIKPHELNKKFKYKIAFGILSLGEDGHFASIIPGDKKTILSRKKYYEYTEKKYKSLQRMTISLLFLSKIKKVYFLVNGEKKGHELNKIIKLYYKHKNFSKKMILKFPLLKILSKCIFLLDNKAYREIKNL